MKRCGKCRETKPFSEFNRNRSRSDGYQGRCRPCQKQTDKDHYHRNPGRKESVRKCAQAAREQAQAYVRAYLSENPCIDCGESDPIVLEFDHVRGTKCGNISDMALAGFSLYSMKNEIEKCDVRCANCHRRVTYLRRIEGAR